MLLTSSSVSHLVDCRPYSKSVSIKFSGVDIRILETGSTNVSEGEKATLSSSAKICSLSVSAIAVVSCAKTNVVFSVSVLIE